MDCVPDSGDEADYGPSSTQHNAGVDFLEAGRGGDRVYSDDEGCYAEPFPGEGEAGSPNGENADLNQRIEPRFRPKPFARAARPSTRPASQARRNPHRRLVTAAAASAAATAASAATEAGAAQDGCEDDGHVDWSQAAAAQPLGRPTAQTGPSFMGRQLTLPRREEPVRNAAAQGAEAPPPRAYNAPRDADAEVAAPGPSSRAQRGPAAISHPPPAAGGAAASGRGQGMATLRTQDGLNVVYNKRKRAADDEPTGAAGGKASKAKASVNSGWGNNFVRIDLKVG